MTTGTAALTLPGNLALCVAIGCLYAAGVYLLLQRTLTRVVIGIGLLGHGANLLLLVSGGPAGHAPLVTLSPGASAGRAVVDTADPLPQAMALTAIVITFALTAFLLALAYRSYLLTQADEVQDDVEDRRIARVARDEEPGARERALLAELDAADPAYDVTRVPARRAGGRRVDRGAVAGAGAVPARHDPDSGDPDSGDPDSGDPDREGRR